MQRLTGTSLERLRAAFNEDFWSTIPAVPGALEACELLADLGYELVCVTALNERFSGARARGTCKILDFQLRGSSPRTT